MGMHSIEHRNREVVGLIGLRAARIQFDAASAAVGHGVLDLDQPELG